MTTFTSWDSELCHHGIKGQKWGIRRFQNPDGTLTAEGKARYGERGTASSKKTVKILNRMDRRQARAQWMGDYSRTTMAKQKYLNRAENGRKAQEYILNSAKKRNLKISSKDVVRHVHTGRDVAGIVALSAISFGTLLPGAYVATTRRAPGEKYKVEK